MFFGGDPASPDTYGKFYADLQMYNNSFDGTDPERYMGNWVKGEISGEENQWLGNNIPRWTNPEYDALVTEFAQTADFDERIRIAKAQNDLLVQDPPFTGSLLEVDAGSPAVDSGRAAGAPAVDLDGTARPQGAGVDRGAHER